MIVETNNRGFQSLSHPRCMEPHENTTIASQSSAIGDYEDSFNRPATSYLWIGDEHRLNREEVQWLVGFLSMWLSTGKFQP